MNGQNRIYLTDITTIGYRKNTGFQLPIRILESDMMNSLDFPCYKIFFVKSGSCLIKTDYFGFSVTAPSITCLNETDFTVVKGDAKLLIILFLPEVVNGNLSASAIRDGKFDGIGVSGTLDLYWAGLFGNRNGKSPAVLFLNPLAENTILEQTGRMLNELSSQESDFWPCLARSYLIELLFLIGSLYRGNNSILVHASHRMRM